MTDEFLIDVLCAFLIFAGITGILIRRNLLIVGFFFQLAFAGVAGILIHIVETRHLTSGPGLAVLVSLVFAIWLIFMSALTIFAYRNRGTINLDELRALID